MGGRTSRKTVRPARRPSARKANSANKRTTSAYTKRGAFGGGTADGNAAMKNLLGGKGANLAEMAGLGLPVPPGFTISTDVCTYFYAHGRQYPAALHADVARHLRQIEQLVGK